MNRINRYLVGGYLRDQIMGRRSNDIDYAVEVASYEELREYVISIGGDIKQEKPEFLTLKAIVNREPADYVVCRIDGEYNNSVRPDGVAVGSIMNDLARRDFTMNAIAMDEDGIYLDPFEGIADIRRHIIRCVRNTDERMWEDPSRMIRAPRFHITHEMDMHSEIVRLFSCADFVNRIVECVSQDVIRNNVAKMFAADTIASMNFFARYPMMAQACFSGGIWMRPTSEKRS